MTNNVQTLTADSSHLIQVVLVSVLMALKCPMQSSPRPEPLTDSLSVLTSCGIRLNSSLKTITKPVVYSLLTPPSLSKFPSLHLPIYHFEMSGQIRIHSMMCYPLPYKLLAKSAVSLPFDPECLVVQKGV